MPTPTAGREEGLPEVALSINSLHIASNSLLASKLQVEITSRNIAGAQDPNYTRQTALVKNLGPGLNSVQGHTHGLGVLVEGFERSRDSLLSPPIATTIGKPRGHVPWISWPSAWSLLWAKGRGSQRPPAT